jgi:hypothetical protein
MDLFCLIKQDLKDKSRKIFCQVYLDQCSILWSSSLHKSLQGDYRYHILISSRTNQSGHYIIRMCWMTVVHKHHLRSKQNENLVSTNPSHCNSTKSIHCFYIILLILLVQLLLIERHEAWCGCLQIYKFPGWQQTEPLIIDFVIYFLRTESKV